MHHQAPSIATPALLLYEWAVQSPEPEVNFIDDTYASLKNRRARILREDFCGTALVACEWVKRRKTNRAFGVDINPEPLLWAEQHNRATLGSAGAKRLALLQGDVLTTEHRQPDIICAFNFSYWLIKERERLKQYFRRCWERLPEHGVLFLDAYGGYDAFRCIVEERDVDTVRGTFTYLWEQERYDPISGDLVCHIHFQFPDGSRLERAFSYHWRLWTLPEICELLTEAGFQRVLVYWQGWDEDGNPDGEFQPVQAGEAEAGWICYLSAERGM